jgi:hypothetical protein
MNEMNSGPDLFNELAHKFAERCRRGERPSLSTKPGPPAPAEREKPQGEDHLD